MDMPLSISLDLDTEADTEDIAARLSPVLRAGDTLLLSGPIGAGKTHFARALIQSRLARAGLHEDVPSPTFTLVQTYSDGEVEIWHADLYRLTSTAELAELGLDDAVDHGIVLVEWPDRLGASAPASALRLDFAAGTDDSSRRLTLTSSEPGWAGRLASVLAPAVSDA